MSPEIFQVPQYFQPVLQRIGDVLDADLSIESYDEEWVNFTVDGYRDQKALSELETKKAEVLPGPDAHNFRIVCPWDPSDEDDGLWLHSLRHSDTPNDYLQGIWYF